MAAALAYFVSPIDAIPDLLFPVGFTDDGAVMAGAVLQLGAHVTSAHREEARRKAEDLFGD